MGTEALFQRQSDWDLMLTSHFHIGLRLRTSGAIHLLPLYAFVLHGVGGNYFSITCFQAQIQGLYNNCKCIAVYKLF
jgi:hypothetical protein